ncbi:type II secretion system F family protein [Methyloprofundus sp.]|uniref:type II secretion system F family protein n=1 Tax=Methyloprofundus sp. TaxID=2020875 RepID=UPI003D099EB4
MPDISELANLYLQLGRMEEAGVSHAQAFNILIETGSPLSASLSKTINFMQQGRPIAESGYRAGLFKQFDRELIRAGEFSGRLGNIYQQMARYYGDKARHVRKIKSQLFFPLSILLLALLIQPIPALFVGSITVMEYILSSFGAFAYILLLMYVCWRLPYWLTDGALRFLGLRQSIFQLQLTLPLIAPWIIRRQVKEFLLILGLMLEAGVPILEAMPKAADTVKNAILTERIREASNALQKGQNLTEALMQINEFKSSTLQIIAIGEQSGKLASSLLHFSKLEAEIISLQEEMLAQWVPHLIYTVITVWMAYSIISSYQAYFLGLDQTISSLGA